MADMDALFSALDAVRRRFVAMLPEHVARLDAFATAPSAEALTATRFAVHKISGTAGTLGYEGLGQMARDVEALLPADHAAPASAELLARITALQNEARRIIASGPDAQPSTRDAAPAQGGGAERRQFGLPPLIQPRSAPRSAS